MKWKDARDCVKAYAKTHNISLNYSQLQDFEDGTLTSYDPEFDFHPIKLSWCKLFEAVLEKEKLNADIPKYVFMIWLDTSI